MDLLESHQLNPQVAPASAPKPPLSEPSLPAAIVLDQASHRPASTKDGDSSIAFLTRIAAQERHVLELKEELQKAEIDLAGLKRQWAAHEPMQQTATLAVQMNDRENTRSTKPYAVSRDPVPQRLHRQSEAMATRNGQRVFSSSKHARALSLLSGKDVEPRPFVSAKEEVAASNNRKNPGSVGVGPAKPVGDVLGQPSVNGEDFIQSSKQLVGGFRSGFWTFLEDLRQVTVGEEPAEPLKHSSSRESAVGRGERRTKLDTPQARRSPEAVIERPDQHIHGRSADAIEDSCEPQKPIRDNHGSDEDWQHWDNYAEHTTSSKIVSSPTECTVSSFSERSTPRSSISSSGLTSRPQQDSMSQPLQDDPMWTSIASLNAGNLTQTASNLMNRWEENFRSGGLPSAPSQDKCPTGMDSKSVERP